MFYKVVYEKWRQSPTLFGLKNINYHKGRLKKQLNVTNFRHFIFCQKFM